MKNIENEEAFWEKKKLKNLTTNQVQIPWPVIGRAEKEVSTFLCENKINLNFEILILNKVQKYPESDYIYLSTVEV